jgi:hypothetical protein
MLLLIRWIKVFIGWDKTYKYQLGIKKEGRAIGWLMPDRSML